jgi:hypothetical protein
MIRPLVHTALHFLVPAAVARWGFAENRLRVFGILTATMVVDLDHLLANPVFDPNRCSIGFHPLHSVAAIGGYALLALLAPWKTVRLAGLGLLIHMMLDGIDCLMM